MRYALGLSGEHVTEPPPADLHGIGLIRGEYVFRRARAYVTTAQGRAALGDYLTRALALYPGQPVWYRTSELDVEEVKVLEGSDDDAVVDRILCMGNRGVRRAMLHPAAFSLELEVLVQAARGHPNLGIIIPFVADPAEAAWAAAAVRQAGFDGALCTMAEIPAAVVSLEEIFDLGYRRALIGLNDLTQFTMAAYRGSNRYPGLPLGVRHMIALARKACDRAGAELAIGGALNSEHLAAAEGLGVDTCVVHYEDLPKVFGSAMDHLPELGRVQEIKRWTRAAIHERRRSLGIQPIDPYGN